jgi:hypothetical protein
MLRIYEIDPIAKKDMPKCKDSQDLVSNSRRN